MDSNEVGVGACIVKKKRGKNDTWLTPIRLIWELGEFDMDPCTPSNMPWQTAKVMLTEKEDGLKSKWEGRIWLNPPFSNIAPWIEKLARHGNGIVLIPFHVENPWFHWFVFGRADAVFVPMYRAINFYDPNGGKKHRPFTPLVLVAYGEENVRAMQRQKYVDGCLMRTGDFKEYISGHLLPVEHFKGA